jgi:hypothetical protein
MTDFQMSDYFDKVLENPEIIAAISSASVMSLLKSCSIQYFSFKVISRQAITSYVERNAISKNLLNSLVELLPLPSAIFKAMRLLRAEFDLLNRTVHLLETCCPACKLRQHIQ